MKIISSNNIFLIALMSAMLLINGCKKEDPAPSEQEVATGKLTANPWQPGTVTVDGVDKTSSFADLKLTFTSNGYTATNGNHVWPSVGTWAFVGDDVTKIKRNDGLEITIVEITDSSLKLSVVWEGTLGPARATSIKGNYVFSLVKG